MEVRKREKQRRGGKRKEREGKGKYGRIRRVESRGGSEMETSERKGTRKNTLRGAEKGRKREGKEGDANRRKHKGRKGKKKQTSGVRQKKEGGTRKEEEKEGKGKENGMKL